MTNPTTAEKVQIALVRLKHGSYELQHNGHALRSLDAEMVGSHISTLTAELASLQRERDGLQEAMAHLAANSYDHHTPHMVCIPTDEWKIAEAMLDDTARGAGNGRGDG